MNPLTWVIYPLVPYVGKAMDFHDKHIQASFLWWMSLTHMGASIDELSK